MQVFTIGYQGLKLEQYVESLLDAGVGIVLDVRETPWSYNRKYIKSVMANALGESGVSYLHLKECGNPKENRRTARTMEECLDNYRDYLRKNTDCLSELGHEIRKAFEVGSPAALTCYERDPHDCHRTILLEELSRLVPDIQVTHIVIEPDSTARKGRKIASDTKGLRS